MKELLEVYKPMAEAFCYQHPECIIKSPVCTFFTQGVHHSKGKVGNDTDGTPLLIAEKHFMPACNSCNDYVEEHPEWAMEHGFKKSKFKK